MSLSHSDVTSLSSILIFQLNLQNDGSDLIVYKLHFCISFACKMKNAKSNVHVHCAGVQCALCSALHTNTHTHRHIALTHIIIMMETPFVHLSLQKNIATIDSPRNLFITKMYLKLIWKMARRIRIIHLIDESAGKLSMSHFNDKIFIWFCHLFFFFFVLTVPANCSVSYCRCLPLQTVQWTSKRRLINIYSLKRYERWFRKANSWLMSSSFCSFSFRCSQFWNDFECASNI